ncbi:MAG TPA: PQQ-binding-like beta-propeller repeat protein [Caldisericia bacterium]|nr:PQQ-binding-like beta-propeller repeat protein [Caldisericia bacterium]
MRKIIHFLRIKNFKLSLLSLFILIAIFANINCNNTYHFKHSNNPIWPMFQYDARRTGQCPYDTSKNNGTLKWKFKVGGLIYSSPAIGSDGTIYVGTDDDYLYALNPDGTLKWKFKANNAISSSPAISSDGTIYVGSLDAINPDGSLKWKFETRVVSDSIPAISKNGTIYIGEERSIFYEEYFYAINPDGSLKWKFETDRGIDSSAAIAADGTIYVGTDELYQRGNKLGSNNNYFYALNPDGTLKWKFKVKEGRHYSSPAISSDGTIYVGVFGTLADDYLYALNPDGSLKWKFKAGASLSSPAISSDGTIYVGSTDTYLYAINPDGSLKWKFKAGDSLSSPAISSDGTIYVGVDEGDAFLYAIGGK